MARLAAGFSDLPRLADVVRRAAAGRPVEYQLDGTIGVDAGSLGQPTFGPMTLMRGELQGLGRRHSLLDLRNRCASCNGANAAGAPAQILTSSV